MFNKNMNIKRQRFEKVAENRVNKIIHYCELEIDRLRKEWDE